MPRVRRGRGPKVMALRKKALELNTGEFTQKQMAQMLGVSVHALSYALMPSSSVARKNRLRKAGLDAEQRRINAFKQKIRREAKRASDGRTREQKLRDAALARKRNSLGQMIAGEARA